MRDIYLLLFLIFSIITSSQSTLKGKVLGKDNIPLESANIYFDGTTISKISDANGNFSIKYEPNANNILVISSMGYQTEYLTNLNADEPVNINLIIAKNELRK